MSAEWETEFEQALMTTLEGNSVLTDLLASSTAICAQRPFQSAGYPQLTYTHRDEADMALSGRGKAEVVLHIDIWGAGDKTAAIRKALQDLLDNRERVKAGLAPSPVTMTNWQCGRFHYLRSHEIATGVMDADSDNQEIIQRVTEWRVTLYRKES